MSSLYTILKRMKKDEILKLANTKCEHGHTLLSHPQCAEKAAGIVLEERVGFLDIESSNLKATFGYTFAYAIKVAGKNEILGRTVTRKEILSGVRDKKLIQECVDDMRKFDRIVTYYGGGFDLPFLRTRAIYWDLDFPVLREIFHTDVYQVIKHKFNLHRRSLEVACQTFGIEAKQHPMFPDQWQEALIGTQWALDYIWEHNKEDVESLEKLYNKIIDHTRLIGSSI